MAWVKFSIESPGSDGTDQRLAPRAGVVPAAEIVICAWDVVPSTFAVSVTWPAARAVRMVELSVVMAAKVGSLTVQITSFRGYPALLTAVNCC